MTTITPVLLSGGSGTRLWPVSRSLHPKQLLPIASERTMLQETVRRFSVNPEFLPPMVVCNDEHRFIIAAQIQALGVNPGTIVLEPVGRNTAAAAAIAALIVTATAPDSLMLVAPSDHVIDDSAAFQSAVAIAATAAEAGKLVTFGINPLHPETGYGYIQRAEPLAGIEGAFSVARFIEKPPRETAEKLLAGGDCFWNSGMFLFSPGALLEELSAHAPEILVGASRALHAARRDLDFLRLDRESFARIPSLSIDYAVMEHTAKAVVVPASMGWSDIGSWSSLWDRGEKDSAGNVVNGDVIVEDSRGNYIRSDGRLLAALGVEDLIIVETGDAVLVCHRDRHQDVKRIVERLAKSNRSEASAHKRVHRPWGFYETLHLAQGTQVKLIEVNPGAALSLQYHHRRAEHWVVVSGEAAIVRGEDELVLRENESTFIPIGMKHRLENRHEQALRIIEVQVGDYLGEDDIVRLEDRYKR
jgi:mannose-1-phosphate guanylyltransferase/mannose-1-phosphate guanylyltransferase/mannose-6-phosphate isomerase